jgi:hypothetical protein
MIISFFPPFPLKLLISEAAFLSLKALDQGPHFPVKLVFSLQQNMMLPYQQLVLDLIILWWRQLLQHKHVWSCSEERSLGLPLS